MSALETVKIVSRKDPTQYAIINAGDFRYGVDTLWEDRKQEAAEPEAEAIEEQMIRVKAPEHQRGRRRG